MLAIADELTVHDLVLRYRVEETDDGFEGEEGSFTICSFWLVSALCEIGEYHRARKLCAKLLSFAGPLQLYAEEIDPHTGQQLGNFPQAFTHLALINAVLHVIRLEGQQHGNDPDAWAGSMDGAEDSRHHPTCQRESSPEPGVLTLDQESAARQICRGTYVLVWNGVPGDAGVMNEREMIMRDEGPTIGPLDDQLAGRLLHQRIVILGTEVDDAVANRICAQLLLLSAEDPRRDISLYINSPGGSVSAGLAIMDTMRLIPNDVSTLAMGLAASMGQFLLSAGTKGKRYALPHARVLMHQGSAGIGGTAVDIEIQAENLEHTRDVVLGLIAEHTGQPRARIDADSLRDRWFTAEEARAYGFVDHVVASLDDIRPAAHASIGLGARVWS